MIDQIIEGRARDLGGFAVRRVLPAPRRRLVGPFIFFDQMGPVALPIGAGLDVRPHPHIALATVTFLFEGEIIHRDSVGSIRAIHPGDVNWMVAGSGIAHSERSSPEDRQRGVKMHGIQCWVALPIEHEEIAPSFHHHPASTLPAIREPGVSIDVIAGTAFGKTSPVEVLSPTLYAHARLEPGARVVLDAEHEERAVYVVEGAIEHENKAVREGELAIFTPGGDVTMTAVDRARIMLLGGAKLSGERHIWWNFVSSSLERIERAKDDWKNERFAKVADDAVERIPLPES